MALTEHADSATLAGHRSPAKYIGNDYIDVDYFEAESAFAATPIVEHLA